MTTPEIHYGSLEPLPGDFDDSLREIDLLLARQSARTSVPRHLADAVYDATLGLFWERLDPLPMPARTPRRTVLSRLAMAATIAMTFGVAALSMKPALEATSPAIAGLLPVEVEHVLMESPIGLDGGADYLFMLEGYDITSEDIYGDFDRMLEELEL